MENTYQYNGEHIPVSWSALTSIMEYFACTFLRILSFPRKVPFPLISHTATQMLADHLQEIKARYCIIQQNTLTNLVNLINNSTYSYFGGFKVGFSCNANNYLPTHHIRRDNSYRSILLIVTLSVASLCSVYSPCQAG